jgi:hypothetical protein
MVSAIERCREKLSVSQSGTCAPSVVAPAMLRAALFSDFGAVAELKRRWGLVEDSIEDWDRLWKRNPALAHMRCEPPIGWVLEAEGRVVGYLGNISLLCRYGDRTLTAVVSHGLAVDRPYRAIGMTLAAAFFCQKSVDLYLCTTATKAVGKMARAFRCNSIPQPDYDTVLFWVLRPYAFAKVVMRKLGLRSPVSNISGMLASPAIATDKVLRRRWPRKALRGLAVTEIGVSEIDDSFQDLWIEKVNEGSRLLVERSPATLRWHFEIPGDRGSTRVLCCSKNSELRGYAVIRNDIPDETSGLRKSIIADMLVKKDDPAVLEALLVAAYSHAKQAGSHILEVLGFPQSVRNICAQWRPYSRKCVCPYHYKAADAVLHNTLSEGGAWYASPFDGDTTLTVRLPAASGAQPDAGDDVVSGVPREDRARVH